MALKIWILTSLWFWAIPPVFHINFVKSSGPSVWHDSSFSGNANLDYGLEDVSLQSVVEEMVSARSSFIKRVPLSDKIVIIDFSKPSFEKRLYIIDLQKNKVVHTSLVAHGKNSGLVYAENFSNEKNSHMSSLGYFRVSEPYFGKHGLSLRLDGLEPGINDSARDRAIVIHSAAYANPEFLKIHGRLGRSFGCPALPEQDYDMVVDMIKDGALLLIYYPVQIQSNFP